MANWRLTRWSWDSICIFLTNHPLCPKNEILRKKCLELNTTSTSKAFFWKAKILTETKTTNSITNFHRTFLLRKKVKFKIICNEKWSLNVSESAISVHRNYLLFKDLKCNKLVSFVYRKKNGKMGPFWTQWLKVQCTDAIFK